MIKPVVSASSHELWRTTIDDARENATKHDARLRALVSGSGAMIQPFIPEIESEGEWSLLFFGGEFSHAVLKRAKSGEFRVQREYGGTHRTTALPTPFVLEQAERALGMAPGKQVYARVDGVVIGGNFVLTELELLEPSLFLDGDPEAPARFASAIAAALA